MLAISTDNTSRWCGSRLTWVSSLIYGRWNVAEKRTKSHQRAWYIRPQYKHHYAENNRVYNSIASARNDIFMESQGNNTEYYSQDDGNDESAQKIIV